MLPKGLGLGQSWEGVGERAYQAGRGVNPSSRRAPSQAGGQADRRQEVFRSVHGSKRGGKLSQPPEVLGGDSILKATGSPCRFGSRTRE